MGQKRTRRDTVVFDTERIFFIKSEVVRGNLKERRPRSKTGIVSRLLARLEVNRIQAQGREHEQSLGWLGSTATEEEDGEDDEEE